MMPALGKVGPRPGCLRGAFSFGRTSWLGKESGCGGGEEGGEKVLPQGLEGARVSTAGAVVPLGGGSTAQATDGFRTLLAPTSYCGCLVQSRAPGAFFLVRRIRAASSGPGGRGLGCPGPAASGLLAPSPE